VPAFIRSAQLAETLPVPVSPLWPATATWFSRQTLVGEQTFAVWLLDFVFALFVLGIAFQYFTIAPMRELDVAQGIWQAIKVDTLSLTAWQIGM
jgi:hypothetical protein